jgi:SPX domain protein involved in polyphosphate accumulation
VNAKIYEEIQERLLPHMELDAYNTQHETYPITNLYYDTIDNSMVRTSLSKPGYREKLRLRSYGVPSGDSKVYVEIKKKCNGLVNKRRSALRLEEAYTFLAGGNAPAPQLYMNVQVLREIAYMVQCTILKPALCISYDRRAYLGIGQSDLRVSFDATIQTRRSDLRIESGIFGELLLAEGFRLMEIKVERNIPLWLCRLLSEYRIYPISFSKYGTEYTRMLAGGL